MNPSTRKTTVPATTAPDASVGPLCLAGGVIAAALIVITMVHSPLVALIAALIGIVASVALLQLLRTGRTDR